MVVVERQLDMNTTHLFLNTTPIDKDKAAEAVRDIYKFCKQKVGRLVFVDGPQQLGLDFDPTQEPLSFFDHNDIAHFGGKRGTDKEDRIRSVISRTIRQVLPSIKVGEYLGSDIVSIPYYMNYDPQNDHCKMDVLLTNLWNNCYAVVSMKNTCYIMERPKIAISNDRGFHCKNGPAVVFKDGTEIYAYEGEWVKREHLLNPETMTLKDIHQGNSKKHILISLVGVDRYLDLVNQWKPDVKNKFKKFYDFHEMVVPGDDEIEESWKKKGWGHRHVEKPYTVRIQSGSVNRNYGTMFRHLDFDSEIIHFKGDPFETDHYDLLFDKNDRDLWNVLNISEARSRAAHSFDITYQDGVFSVSTNKRYEGPCPHCHHDIAPAWFKAKMFLKEDAYYVNEKLDYVVKYDAKDDKVSIAGDNVLLSSSTYKSDKLLVRNSLFRGCENLPSYCFELNLTSDSWEGLLEKWAWESFDWLHLHSDSCRMP